MFSLTPVDQLSLSRFAGPAGPATLYSLLSTQYPSSTAQRHVLLLFSLLQSRQPTQLITEGLARYENSTLKAVNVTNSGEGYTEAPPLVSLSGPEYTGGRGARATAVMERTGRVLRLDLKRNISAGSASLTRVEKASTPRVFVTAPRGEGGRGIEATARVKKGDVTGLTVTNQGYGYSEKDVVKVQVGRVLADVDVVWEYRVAEVRVTDPGSGYARGQTVACGVDPPPVNARTGDSKRAKEAEEASKVRGRCQRSERREEAEKVAFFGASISNVQYIPFVRASIPAHLMLASPWVLG